MIDDIKILKVASYDNNGIHITGLKKVNFFYGPNGCGKTTISNYLANSESDEFTSCSVTWERSAPLKTLVYNKQFCKDNFDTSNGNIAGVFTLGQATKENLDTIAQKKNEVDKLCDDRQKLEKTSTSSNEKLKRHEDTFSDDGWRVYKQYENDFKKALHGYRGSKKIFIGKILDEYKSNSMKLLSFDDLKMKGDIFFDKKPQKIEPLSRINPLKFQEIEEDSIWRKIIVGKKDVDIAALITKLGNSDWVNQGRQYIGEDPTCPFCQKATVGELFTQQIEEYFDESFENNKNRLALLKKDYQQSYENMVATLNEIKQSEKSNPYTKLDVDTFSLHLKAIDDQLSKNVLLIQRKLEKTSQPIELIDTKETFDAISMLIGDANKEIDKHNQRIDNYDQEWKSFKKSVWNFLIGKLGEKRINAYEKNKDSFQKGIAHTSDKIKNISERIKNLENEIVDLNKNVTSVQPAVDEINRSLSAYDFTNFSIADSPELSNHYVIKRDNGDLAHHTLSEGEITFITFLYFIQLAKGALDKESVTEDRVLVIDDPICSLDSNVLHVVSTIVKDLIKKITAKENKGQIKQLILLTHNVCFHKEASFQGGRFNGNKDMHFWILKKSKNITFIKAYKRNNPIKSSYELLWQGLKEWEKNSDVTLLPNAMRRIIEHYFKFLGNVNDDYLIKQFNAVEDQQIFRSLISWMHEGSHAIIDPLYVGMLDSSAEQYMKVFKKIFDNTGNSGHYEMMMNKENR